MILSFDTIKDIHFNLKKKKISLLKGFLLLPIQRFRAHKTYQNQTNGKENRHRQC